MKPETAENYNNTAAMLDFLQHIAQSYVSPTETMLKGLKYCSELHLTLGSYTYKINQFDFLKESDEAQIREIVANNWPAKDTKAANDFFLNVICKEQLNKDKMLQAIKLCTEARLIINGCTIIIKNDSHVAERESLIRNIKDKTYNVWIQNHPTPATNIGCLRLYQDGELFDTATSRTKLHFNAEDMSKINAAIDERIAHDNGQIYIPKRANETKSHIATQPEKQPMVAPMADTKVRNGIEKLKKTETIVIELFRNYVALEYGVSKNKLQQINANTKLPYEPAGITLYDWEIVDFCARVIYRKLGIEIPDDLTINTLNDIIVYVDKHLSAEHPAYKAQEVPKTVKQPANKTASQAQSAQPATAPMTIFQKAQNWLAGIKQQFRTK